MRTCGGFWRRPRLPGSRHCLSYVYVVIGALLLAGFLLLYPIRHVDGFATELRINIGSNMLDLVLAVLVLQPLVLSLNRNAVRRRNRLGYREVIRRIERSTDRVDVWKYWTGLLEPRLEQAEVAMCGDGRRRYVLGEAGQLTSERVAALYAARYGPVQGAVLRRLITR